MNYTIKWFNKDGGLLAQCIKPHAITTNTTDLISITESATQCAIYLDDTLVVRINIER